MLQCLDCANNISCQMNNGKWDVKCGEKGQFPLSDSWVDTFNCEKYVPKTPTVADRLLVIVLKCGAQLPAKVSEDVTLDEVGNNVYRALNEGIPLMRLGDTVFKTDEFAAVQEAERW